MHKAATPHLSSPRRETSPSAVGSGAQLLFVDKEIGGNAKTLTPGATPIRLDSSCGARPQDVGLEGASCNVNTGTQQSLSSALGAVDIECLERKKNCRKFGNLQLHLSAEIGRGVPYSSEAAGAAGALAGGLGLTLFIRDCFSAISKHSSTKSQDRVAFLHPLHKFGPGTPPTPPEPGAIWLSACKAPCFRGCQGFFHNNFELLITGLNFAKSSRSLEAIPA